MTNHSVNICESGGFFFENMKAIICERDGYYISSVFAQIIIDPYYSPEHAVYRYVVFNREKNKLISVNLNDEEKHDEHGRELPEEDWIKRIIFLKDTDNMMEWEKRIAGDATVYTDILYSLDPGKDITENIEVTETELKKCEITDKEEIVSLCGDLSSDRDQRLLFKSAKWLKSAKLSSFYTTEDGMEIIIKGDWGFKIKLSLHGNVDFSIVNTKVFLKEDNIFCPCVRVEVGEIDTETEGRIFLGDYPIPLAYRLPSEQKGHTWFAADKITYEILPNCCVTD